MHPYVRRLARDMRAGVSIAALLAVASIEPLSASAPETETEPTTVIIGGDVLLGRGVAERAEKEEWPGVTAGLKRGLARADLARFVDLPP